MHDAVTGGHPLSTARAKNAVVPQDVAVLEGAIDHVGDRLEAAVWMLGKPGDVVLRTIGVKLVKEEKGIQQRERLRAQRARQVHTRSFHGGLGLHALHHLTLSMFGLH